MAQGALANLTLVFVWGVCFLFVCVCTTVCVCVSGDENKYGTFSL